MIAPCGTFDYRVVVDNQAGAADRWIGQACSLRSSSMHPGSAGARPLFELADGQIILRATESRLARWINPHFRSWGRPGTYQSFEVGNAPAAAMEAGDQVAFHRHCTGDYALTIIRSGSLVLGLGAITSLPLGSEINVEEDARLRELELYELAGDSDEMGNVESRVIWIDIDKRNLEAQLEPVRRAPESSHMIIAIKRSRTERVPDYFWDRLLDCDACFSSYHVDERFSDKQAWIEYVRQLPRARPKDLHITFATGGEQINLCEGEEANIGAYYVRVERIYRRGIPGEFSMLGIGRLSETLTRDRVIESLALIRKC
jgi:hypothetical protein